MLSAVCCVLCVYAVHCGSPVNCTLTAGLRGGFRPRGYSSIKHRRDAAGLRPCRSSNPHQQGARAQPLVIPLLRYVQYALRGGCRWVRDKLNHSIQERDPCGTDAADQPGSGRLLLSSRRAFLAIRPGDHGTLPVRRTYASLEDDGPFRGQPSSRGHRLRIII